LLVDVGLIKYRTGLYQHSMLERIRRRVERLEKREWSNVDLGGDTVIQQLFSFKKKLDEPFKSRRRHAVPHGCFKLLKIMARAL
jgi:hypothetical protein